VNNFFSGDRMKTVYFSVDNIDDKIRNVIISNSHNIIYDSKGNIVYETTKHKFIRLIKIIPFECKIYCKEKDSYSPEINFYDFYNYLLRRYQESTANLYLRYSINLLSKGVYDKSDIYKMSKNPDTIKVYKSVLSKLLSWWWFWGYPEKSD